MNPSSTRPAKAWVSIFVASPTPHRAWRPVYPRKKTQIKLLAEVADHERTREDAVTSLLGLASRVLQEAQTTGLNARSSGSGRTRREQKAVARSDARMMKQRAVNVLRKEDRSTQIERRQKSGLTVTRAMSNSIRAVDKEVYVEETPEGKENCSP